MNDISTAGPPVAGAFGRAAAPRRRGFATAEIGRLGVFAVLFVVASLLSPAFLTLGNLQAIVMAVSVVGVIAFGMTIVLIAGEIDLSVASTAALSAVVGGSLIGTGSSALVIGATLLAGAAVGLVNGIGVAVFRVPSLIVTLAMLSIARALCNILSGGQALYPESLAGYVAIGRGSILGVPSPILILLVAAAAGIVATRALVFGRRLYAVGGNAGAAALSGIAVPQVKIAVFVVSGLCAAMAGMIESSRLAYINPAGFNGYELEAIAIAVLGGASLFGGRGSIEGALIAAAIMGIISNVLNLLGVSIYLQQVVIAAVIVVVVLPDSFRRDRS